MPTCAHQADGHWLKSKRCGVLRVGPSWVCIGTVHAGCLKRLGCDFGSRSCLGRLPLHWVRPPSGCCSIAVTWLWPLPWLGCGGALSVSRWLAKLLLGCGFCCGPATSQDTFQLLAGLNAQVRCPTLNSLYASIPMLLSVLLMPLLTPHCSHSGGDVTAPS